jgi:hypothetical protein
MSFEFKHLREFSSQIRTSIGLRNQKPMWDCLIKVTGLDRQLMLLSKLLCHTINKHFPQRALGLFNKLDFARLPHVSGSLFAETPGTELFFLTAPEKWGKSPGM